MTPLIEKLITKSFKYSSMGKIFKSPNDPLSKRIIETGEDTSQNTLKSYQEPAQNKSQLLNKIEARIAKSSSDLEHENEQLLEEVTFSNPAQIETILQCLQAYGVAIFPALYQGEALDKIRKEYRDIITTGERFAYYVHSGENNTENSFGIDFKRRKLSVSKHPELARLFGSEILWKITHAYFCGQNFEFNKDMFAQWTEHTDSPLSGVLHWDKQLTLKSWLYLSEATDGYGAMRVEVGSAAWTRYVREDAIFDGIPYDSIKNQLDETNSTISTGGPAGTFFIFVTDTAHGATPVEKGRRREIIRAQSRPHRITDWTSWASKL